jgi:cell fate regulator YaaT (PSP1 superfamily)
MGCGSCSTGNGCSTGGCKSGGCATGGCNKLNTFDWFGNMLSPDVAKQDAIYEVRFKATHKGFYRNINGLDLVTGDIITVESERGFDVGTISLSGELVRLQMKRKKVDAQKVLKIYRLATPDDLEKLKTARSREMAVLLKTREIIEKLKVEMKLSEVEIQGDNTKATFYYTADNRVDFRELIKVMADEFRLRIEMKQIGLRQEAGLIGGIGSCGRELCCSTWLSDFKNVSTGAARYQNLSLNPMKISGQCGRLKCCLNYELETYMDALKGIPDVQSIETEMGIARLQKTDIFKKKMWFSYADSTDWHGVEVKRVIELQSLNKKGIKPTNLFSNEELKAMADEKIREKAFDFVDVVGQSKINERPLNPQKNKNRKPGFNKNNSGTIPEKGFTNQNKPNPIRKDNIQDRRSNDNSNNPAGAQGNKAIGPQNKSPRPGNVNPNRPKPFQNKNQNNSQRFTNNKNNPSGPKPDGPKPDKPSSGEVNP